MQSFPSSSRSRSTCRFSRLPELSSFCDAVNKYNVIASGTWHQLTYAYDGKTLKSYLDDVRIYSRALSAAEIQALYNAEK